MIRVNYYNRRMPRYLLGSTASTILGTIAILAALDMLILLAAAAQVAYGQGTGIWAPYWQEQLRFISQFIQ